MSDLGPAPEDLKQAADRLADFLGYARAHAATGDSRVWVDDLETILRVAWDLLTHEQKAQSREHPDIAALIEAAGGTSLPP